MTSYIANYHSPLRSLENNLRFDNAKLREKIAARRSILNDCDDKLRRLMESQCFSPTVQKHSPNKAPSSFNLSPTLSTFSLSSGQSIYSKSPQNDQKRSPLHCDLSVNNQSIHRKRERKEAAEMRLRGLFSRSLSVVHPNHSEPVTKTLSFSTASTLSTLSSDERSMVKEYSSKPRQSMVS